MTELFSKLSPELISNLTSSFGLSNDQASQTISTTKDSLVSSLGKEVSSGNMDGILSMVNNSSNLTSNPMFSGLVSKLAQDYGSKLGLSSEKTMAIASFILPKIISAISGSKSGNIEKTDLMSMVGSAAGDAIKNKASDALKKGLGNFFK
ncbi:DUF937 domain-containing protein [Belliella aquatica]|uniref:DUF937 domain-containing protein n=1 Tax=Belliella aquatica TaxID=1323734 RepID=A0ABQ1LUH8_9BACT|nr:DUF937 domain-containing protein [Belliella aquatica]MCH7407219.1 DUF937 domain-containing protein [Belliella aquatica]GGC29659.1 hypothetical protein GCM10010993_05750 [Belliella aquatica]